MDIWTIALWVVGGYLALRVLAAANTWSQLRRLRLRPGVNEVADQRLHGLELHGSVRRCARPLGANRAWLAGQHCLNSH